MARRLTVLLNGRLVGEIDMARSGAISFRYAPDWLAWEHTLPVSLSLPLQEQVHQGAPVIAYLENLLPDNPVIRERWQPRPEQEAQTPTTFLRRSVATVWEPYNLSSVMIFRSRKVWKGSRFRTQRWQRCSVTLQRLR